VTIKLEAFLSHGYFPKELPPSFNSKQFGKFVHNNAPIQPTALPGARGFNTLSGIHHLVRPAGQRRTLHLPNPFSYYLLCDLLSGHWPSIKKHCNKSKLSISAPTADKSGTRAVRTKLEGAEIVRHRAAIRRYGRFLVRTDISRFYDSIYTHSIPWALVGKAVAKVSRKGGFANDLDARIRELQDGQTLGIPIGPDASLIISEIVASAIDERLQKAKLTGMRFIDDYELIFPSRAAAEAGLVIVEEALSGFELAINPRKTFINELPIEIDRKWPGELRSYFFLDEEKVTADELIRYFNLAFELKASNQYDPVLSYAIERLRNVTSQDWELLQDLLCQCALAERGTMSALIAQFEFYRLRGPVKALDRLISIILEDSTPLARGSEIVWALWAAIWFSRPIPIRLARRLDGIPDPFVAILALHAKSLGLIAKSVTFPLWAQEMRRTSLYGPNWLLAYEADVKGWLPSTERPNHVDSDPNFSQLKSAGVSFYDDSITVSSVSRIQSIPSPSLSTLD
jgi:hypothetical protein